MEIFGKTKNTVHIHGMPPFRNNTDIPKTEHYNTTVMPGCGKWSQQLFLVLAYFSLSSVVLKENPMPHVLQMVFVHVPMDLFLLCKSILFIVLVRFWSSSPLYWRCQQLRGDLWCFNGHKLESGSYDFLQHLSKSSCRFTNILIIFRPGTSASVNHPTYLDDGISALGSQHKILDVSSIICFIPGKFNTYHKMM